VVWTRWRYCLVGSGEGYTFSSFGWGAGSCRQSVFSIWAWRFRALYLHAHSAPIRGGALACRGGLWTLAQCLGTRCLFAANRCALFVHFWGCIRLHFSVQLALFLMLLFIWLTFFLNLSNQLCLFGSCTALPGFIRLPLVRWNKVEAEAKHSTQSGRVQNEPSFGHKRLSGRVLLHIRDRLRRKLLFQRTSGRRKKPGNAVSWVHIMLLKG